MSRRQLGMGSGPKILLESTKRKIVAILLHEQRTIQGMSILMKSLKRLCASSSQPTGGQAQVQMNQVPATNEAKVCQTEVYDNDNCLNPVARTEKKEVENENGH